MQPPTLSQRHAHLALRAWDEGTSRFQTNLSANRARELKPRTSMLISCVAAAGLLTSPATSTRRATAVSLRLCATLDEGLEVAVFAMG